MSGPLTDQPVLELIFAIAIPGISSAIMFNMGASSGGTDIVAMILKKYTSMNIGTALLAVDLLIAEHKKHSRNPYLFPSPKTGTMYDPDAFRRTHDKILKAIGAEHIRFHDLRHTFATLSLKSGVDVKTLSGALGHYSAGFTLNTYTHATAQMKQDAADTIGGVINQQMR